MVSRPETCKAGYRANEYIVNDVRYTIQLLNVFSGINPSINLSLSAPKHCLKHFNGENYLGGRFLPAGIKTEFNLSLPEYPDQEQIVKFEKSQIDFTAE